MEKQCEKRRMEKPENPESEIIFGCDSPEKIAMCLNCKKPYCTDCLSYYGKHGNPRPLLNIRVPSMDKLTECAHNFSESGVM